MGPSAINVPQFDDLLCEHCGYALNGLSDQSRCPECGSLIRDNIGSDRKPSAWDTADAAADGRRLRAFIGTTSDLIRHPAKFYRGLTVGGSAVAARRFARWHWAIAAALIAATVTVHELNLAVGMHADAIGFLPTIDIDLTQPTVACVVAGVTFAYAYFGLDAVTRLAAKLTTLEGTYRGYRMPFVTVLRALYFHAAHYLPATLLVMAVPVGFKGMTLIHPDAADLAVPYLWTFCGAIVLSAFYLFETYWVGMSNMLYANR